MFFIVLRGSVKYALGGVRSEPLFWGFFCLFVFWVREVGLGSASIEKSVCF